MPDTQGTFLLVLHGCQLRGRASTSFGCRPTATRAVLLVVRRRWAEACPACPASVHPVAQRGARDGVLVGHPARRPRPRQLVARAARAGRRRAEPAVGGLWMAWHAHGVRMACMHGICTIARYVHVHVRAVPAMARIAQRRRPRDPNMAVLAADIGALRVTPLELVERERLEVHAASRGVRAIYLRPMPCVGQGARTVCA